MPKAWSWANKFDSDFALASLSFSDGNDFAFLFLPGGTVRQAERLSPLHICRQQNQCARFADHLRMGVLQKRDSAGLATTNHNGDFQKYTRSAAYIGKGFKLFRRLLHAMASRTVTFNPEQGNGTSVPCARIFAF